MLKRTAKNIRAAEYHIRAAQRALDREIEALGEDAPNLCDDLGWAWNHLDQTIEETIHFQIAEEQA